jgi:hypothetical protein
MKMCLLAGTTSLGLATDLNVKCFILEPGMPATLTTPTSYAQRRQKERTLELLYCQ